MGVYTGPESRGDHPVSRYDAEDPVKHNTSFRVPSWDSTFLSFAIDFDEMTSNGGF